MLLCIDVGNSQLCCGIFHNQQLILQFRYDTKNIGSSDELGIFILSVLRENQIDTQLISKIGVSSVVPSIDYTIRAFCIKYFKLTPIFLQIDLITNINIKTKYPHEVGSDLIAAAIAGVNLYPEQSLIIFDLGTATTCSYIDQEGSLIGVAITPGMRLMMSALQNNTAKLFGVDFVAPKYIIGNTTKLAIQSGLYFTQLGFIKEMITQINLDYRLIMQPIVIGTGGFSQLFANTNIFTHMIPELVLLGIKYVLEPVSRNS